jgi:hypothetical protein
MYTLLQLEPSSWDPFVNMVLYHIYHDTLPEGLSPAQVLEAARLADRLQVGGAMSSLGTAGPSSAGAVHALRASLDSCACSNFTRLQQHAEPAVSDTLMQGAGWHV